MGRITRTAPGRGATGRQTFSRREFLVATTAMGLAAACAPAPTATTTTTSSTPAAAPQALVSKDRDEFATTDPASVSSNGDANVTQNIMDALVRVKPGTSEIVPNLAETWDVSADGLVYTFHLRKGVKWQKGFGELTAADVVYSYNRIMDPATASRYRTDWAPVKSVDAPDDYTVRITMKTSYPGFILSALTFRSGFIVKKDAIEKYGKDYGTNPVGTGPFMLQSVTPGVGWTMVRNPDYWGPRPALDRVDYKLIKDEQVAELALEKGELDAAYFESPEMQLKVRGLKNVVILDRPMPRTFFTYVNMQRSPLDNVKVRQALAWATNKKGIVDNVFLGQGSVGESMIPPGMIGHSDDAMYGYDLDKARQLLAEAGHPNGFPDQEFQFVTLAVDPAPSIVQVQQSDWEKIGFHTKVESLDIATLNARRMANTYDVLTMFTLRAESAQFVAQYLHSRSIPFENIEGYRGADDLINQSETEQDPTKRAAIYAQLHKQIQSDVPIIPIAYPVQVLATKPTVQGAAIGLLSLPLWQMSVASK